MSPRVAFIQPELRGFGGLENYSLYVIGALASRTPLDLVTASPLDEAGIARAFGMELPAVQPVTDPRADPLPREGSRLERTRAERDFALLTSRYDLVVSPTIGLPWRAASRRSVLICHFPCVREQRLPDGGLAPLWTSTGRLQREVARRVGSWSSVLTSSHYARRWLREIWQRDAAVVHPVVEIGEAPALSQKRRIILGAGFFRPPDPGGKWSYKRHEILIEAFKLACEAGLNGWELRLAGHAAETAEVRDWIAELRTRAEGFPITLHPNCPRTELVELYRQASIFWHAVGYGVDQEVDPARMEHFGIVTAEASAWGCVPIVINGGGQPEIVRDGETGCLWSDLESWVSRTLEVASDEALRRRLAGAAMAQAGRFSEDVFRDRIGDLLSAELQALEASR